MTPNTGVVGRQYYMYALENIPLATKEKNYLMEYIRVVQKAEFFPKKKTLKPWVKLGFGSVSLWQCALGCHG